MHVLRPLNDRELDILKPCNTDRPTKCEIPRAPPPPSTNPMDFPHIRLASRAKSFACALRVGRGLDALPRYL